MPITAELPGASAGAKLSSLANALNEILSPEVLQGAARVVADLIRKSVQGNSPIYEPQSWEKVLEHEPGAFRKSWTEPVLSGDALYSFQNPQSYAGLLESGLYPEEMVVSTRRDGTPGRLIKTGTGIFSTQAKTGVVTPVIHDEKKIAEMAKLVGQQIAVKLKELMK
jgi:hypothetical protein